MKVTNISNAVNEIDQLFRQKHVDDDIANVLKRLINAELIAAQKENEELKSVIAGVSSYLEGDPTFTRADEVLDKVEKIAREYYSVYTTSRS